jgi:dipeptidyl aminopeptidase/acylaminoacyl peptidase
MFRASLFMLATCLSVSVAAKPVPPTIEQLAAFPKMSNFSVSVDGKHVVALEARGEDRIILVWNADDLSAAPTTIGSSQMKIQSVRFLKNDLLAVTLWQPYDARFESVTKTFISKLFITDLKGKKWQEPLPLPTAKTESEESAQAATSPTVLDTLPDDPDYILVVNNVGASSGDVFKVNVRTNRAERIQRSEQSVSGYITAPSGELAARTKLDTDNTGAYISTQLKNASGGWEEHFKSYVKDRDVVNVVGFTTDPNIAIVQSNIGQDRNFLYEYDIAQKKPLETLFKHRYFEAESIITWPFASSDIAKKGEIIALTYDGPNGGDTEWVNPTMKALDDGIAKALGIVKKPLRVVDLASGESANILYNTDTSYSITSITPDLNSVIVRADGSNSPPAYYMLRNGKLTLLAKSYADIDPKSLGKTELIYYKARDGLDVPAYLTKPNEEMCGKGPWPSVVHPHGGPWARDHGGFDGSMWVPLLSSRCRAVLQPQYRGSQGWGRKLWKAGDAEWGQKMQDDKDDGAQYLIDQNIAQKDHIAMFGFSYGGYAAFAAAVRPNGYYKCAIAGAGVSDIKKIWAKFYTNPFFRDAQAPTVNGLNPLDKADQISIPLMVYHGVRDQTVPIEQSRWFVSKAKKAGRDVTYHELSDYAHGPAWTRKIMGDQLGFIDDYLNKGCSGGL